MVIVRFYASGTALRALGTWPLLNLTTTLRGKEALIVLRKGYWVTDSLSTYSRSTQLGGDGAEIWTKPVGTGVMYTMMLFCLSKGHQLLQVSEPLPTSQALSKTLWIQWEGKQTRYVRYYKKTVFVSFNLHNNCKIQAKCYFYSHVGSRKVRLRS